MRATSTTLLLLALTAMAVGCETTGDPAPSDAESDAGPADAGRLIDAGRPVQRDAGPPPPRYVGLPVSCWFPPNSFCNPANNEGCDAGEACDLGSDNGQPIVACFPPPADRGLGQACDNDTGPFCQGGLRCMGGECMDTCCTDDECPDTERCVPLDQTLGSLGVCQSGERPVCEGPGGFCRDAPDCCSGVCHVGHCH